MRASKYLNVISDVKKHVMQKTNSMFTFRNDDSQANIYLFI